MAATLGRLGFVMDLLRAPTTQAQPGNVTTATGGGQWFEITTPASFGKQNGATLRL